MVPPIFDGLPVKGLFTTKGAASSLQTVSGLLSVTARDIYLPIQEHTDRVLVIDYDTEPRLADAVLTNRRGVFVGIRTADCVPLLLYDKKRSVAGAVHAGWRGTAAGILKKALRTMTERFSSSPEDILIAVGPAIGCCCYEVGPEVPDGVLKASGAGDYIKMKGSRHHIDLPEANRLQALSMGILQENIWLSGECTFCNPDKYYSYRHDKGVTGRQYAIIGITR